jgi:Spy/CpxP family protein refolding chaperone
MNKTRFAVKWFAGTLAATALVFSTLAAPAQAAKPDSGNQQVQPMRGDTGWGGV